MYLLKHAGRELVRGGGGSFVGISSIASSNIHRWFGADGVSKAALDHLLMLAADELGPSWVRVNSIRPGLTRTEMVGPIMEVSAVTDDYRACTPLPRVGEVEEMLCDCSAYRVDAELREQVANPALDVVADRPHGVDGLAGRVG